ncbi:hypothetical protein GOODEAATRI_000217 [Goodea atripinnis]|uniref:Uncharacterized protein n=1 Tax=Goodea atripinnis TaxID=208336 RepID=A0ABV0ME41_9TELE
MTARADTLQTLETYFPSKRPCTAAALCAAVPLRSSGALSGAVSLLSPLQTAFIALHQQRTEQALAAATRCPLAGLIPAADPGSGPLYVERRLPLDVLAVRLQHREGLAPSFFCLFLIVTCMLSGLTVTSVQGCCSHESGAARPDVSIWNGTCLLGDGGWL